MFEFEKNLYESKNNIKNMSEKVSEFERYKKFDWYERKLLKSNKKKL